MSRDCDRDVHEALALDHFWDRLSDGESGGTADIDPADITTIRAFHAHIPHEEPDPQFVARLETRLLEGVRAGYGTVLSPHPMFGSNGHGPRRANVTHTGEQAGQPPLARLFAPTGMVGRLAAVVVLLVLVVGAVVATLYPHREWHDGALPLFAPSGTPAPQQAGESTLFDLTIAETASFRLEGIGAYQRLPPGSTIELSSGQGPSILYVTQGPVTVRVSAAPQPMRLLPSRATGSVEAGEPVAAGQQATLESDMTFVAAAGSRIQLFTTSFGTAEVLWVLGAGDGMMQNRDGVSGVWSSNGGSIVDMAGPLSVVLRQVTLRPNETLPVQGSGQWHQTAATVDPQRVGDMRTVSDGSLRNGSDQPLVLYVLTVSPLAGGTPTTGPPGG